MDYIKSSMNYVGGKYKLLPQIVPLFPNNINTFVDLFGGGFNVGINVNANKIIYNDIENHVVGLLQYFKDNGTDILLYEIDSLIEKFKLTKENADGFNRLRDYYNYEDNSPIVFYTMICYAFNYQIRFNKDGKYNMPFGKDRSSFNPTLRKKFVAFVEAIHSKNCQFCNVPFNKFSFNELKCNDFVYCDPPYYNSVAAYNEQGGWTEKDEVDLLECLDLLNMSNIRFALSNNLKYENPYLDKWKDKYNVNYLVGDYSNCNYHKKNNGKDIEVLITNYQTGGKEWRNFTTKKI
jgi:DNA adenine methylase/adenine-specific DNA-methyltransferase